MGQFEFDFLDFFFDSCNVLFRFVLIELQDSGHFNFHQAENVFLGYLTYKLWVVRSQAVIDVCTSSIHVFGLLKFLVFINAFFDEYLFE